MKFILIILLIASSYLSLSSQKSKDPEFQKIEDTAWNRYNAGDYEGAIEIFSQLLSHPSLTCQTEGREYKFIANTLLTLNRKEESLDIFLNKVLPVWENCDSLKKSYLVSPYNSIAERYINLKKPTKALHYAYLVINLYETGNGREHEYQRLAKAYRLAAAANSMLGNAYLSYRFLEAAQYTNTTRVALRNQPKITFEILQEKIRTQYEDEKYEDAIQTSDEALIYHLNSSLGYTPSRVGIFALRANKLKCYLNLKKLNNAKVELNYLRDNKTHIQSKDTETQYYQLSAQYNNLVGNQQAAIDSLMIAADLAAQISDMSNRAMNNLNLAEVYHKMGNLSLTDGYISKAVGNLVTTDQLNILDQKIALEGKSVINYDDLFYVLSAYYDMKLDFFKESENTNYLDDMIAIFDEIDYLVKSSRSDYKSEFSQLTQIEKVYIMYEQIISYLVKQKDQKYIIKALEYSINNKSTILHSQLKKRKNEYTNLSDSDKRKLINQENDIRSLEQAFLISDDRDKDSLNILYLEKYTQNFILNHSLQSKNTEAIRSESDLSNIEVRELVEILEDGEALVEIYFGKRECFSFLVLDGEVSTIRTPLTDNLNQILVSTIDNLMNEGPISEYKTNAFTIYDTFFSKLLSNDDIKKIIIIPDGLFHDLPIGSLWDGNKYLIQDFDISNLNNAQQLIDESTYSDLSYIGFGTSYTQNLGAKLETNYSLTNIRLSTLDNAQTEIKSGEEVFGGKSYLGASSTLSSFHQNENEISGILHFALHGLILDEYNSAVLFDDRADNFMLTSNQVYTMDLNNYLSILSACYSADGKIYAGEGVRSLGRAFIAAGSENIISSLWAASDQANTKIMASFFEGVKNRASLPHALSDAKRSFIATANPSMRHPNNWANMILIGPGHNTPSTINYWLLGWVILGLLLIILTIKLKKR